MLRCVARRAVCTAAALQRLPPSAVQSVHERLQPQLRKLRERHGVLAEKAVLSDSDASELRKLSPLAELLRQSDAIAEDLTQVQALKADEDEQMAALAADEEQVLQGALVENALAQLSHLLSSRADASEAPSVILEIRAGTGGDEAMLFANDLYGMYTKLCARRKWRVKQLSHSESSRGGVREVVLRVSGHGVGVLEIEAGVHRVQRVPETETQGRVHTSTATVLVLSDQLEETVDIKESDVRVDVFRASGAGGQHVNRTESAVRVTHIPTGLTASCQEERSQRRNKASAMDALKLRVGLQAQKEAREKRMKERRQQAGSVMGERSDRIRTYNFAQRRVTDHRIVIDGDMQELGVQVGGKNARLDDVLEGELDELIASVQTARQFQALSALLQTR